MTTKIKTLFVRVLTIVLMIFAACSKVDTTHPEKENSDPALQEEKFFNTHRTSDRVEKSIVEFLKSANNKSDFVHKTIKQIGFPRWDKAILTQKNSTGRRGNTLTDSLILIPFVRDTQNYVNASMVIELTENDTIVNWICDWQYTNRAYTTDSLQSNTAEKFALFMMMVDAQVFGHKDFYLSDTMLFRGLSQFKSQPLFGSGSNRRIHLEQDSSANTGNRTSAMSGPVPTYNYTMWYFSMLDYYGLNSFHGSIPDFGTGGGSGSTAVPPPPSCGSVAARGQVIAGCTPGWYIPAGGTNANPSLLPPYVLNLLTKPCLKAVLNKLSSGTSNTLFKQIYNTFDTSLVNHLYINERDLTTDSAYGLAYPPLALPSGGVSFVITMDTVNLMNCSQEWMAYVMIHEVAHAAMFANIVLWDTANTQHEAMMSQYLTKMATALTSAYPGLSAFDAYSICYTGFNNGIDGNGASAALLYIMLKKVKQKLNNHIINAQQLINRGEEYTESGTKGLRTGCN